MTDSDRDASSRRAGLEALRGLSPAEALAWLDQQVWQNPSGEHPVMRALRALAQLIALTARGFQTDRLLLRASALTYVTALSVIPTLAVVIAVVGVLGGDETLVEFVIEQLTSVAPEARTTVERFAKQLDFTRFGRIGGAIVVGSAIFALRHLETTLNEIWGVGSPRSWARRFSDYLAVLIVAPLSTGVAVSLGTSLQSAEVVAHLLQDETFARIYGLGLAQLPLLVLLLGFTFLYWFFPNTKVHLGPAALGGAVAAVLFSAARKVYVDFQVGAATYEAVFGALSALPLILVWLYACWAVLLLGAEVAFAAQNLPFARREMRHGEATAAEQEAIALEIAYEIARRFEQRAPAPSAEVLADALDEPVRLVRRLTDGLVAGDLVRAVQTETERDPAYLPSAPLDKLSVGDVLRATRGELDAEIRRRVDRSPEVAETLERLDGAWRRVADDTTLAALCQARRAAENEVHA